MLAGSGPARQPQLVSPKTDREEWTMNLAALAAEAAAAGKPVRAGRPIAPLAPASSDFYFRMGVKLSRMRFITAEFLSKSFCSVKMYAT